MNSKRTSGGRQLRMEHLDPRIVLSVNFPTSSLAESLGTEAIVEHHESRTTFRNLAVATSPVHRIEAATSFLKNNAAALGLPADIWENVRVVELKNGLASSHVRFMQTHDDITVHEGYLSVHMNDQGVVQTLHSAYRPLTPVSTERAPAIGVSAAIAAAEKHAGIESTFADPHSELVWNVAKDGSASLAWDVTVYGNNPTGDFVTLVDATTGQVLRQENQIDFAQGTGNVFEPNPYQTQGSGSGLTDSNDANNATLTAQMRSVTLEGLDEGTGLLRGEFVNLSSLNSPNIADVDANEPTRIYNYTRDDPRFEQVVVYHAVDQLNRYFHALGFDDDSGVANGIRDFPTLANAHWYTADNSFYSTGNDAIHFGDGGVDDAEDADIVAHEYGHAVQHDQNAFWGGGEMGAMGEGFGDYLAASFYAETGNAAFLSSHAAAVGEWDAVSYSSANPPNLRRVDGNKMYPTNLTGAVHADGEIWSAALWDIRGALGKNTTDQLILESHFALPGSATMPDAANAIITADNNLNGGANVDTITFWFEERGILGDLPSDDHGNNAASATPMALNSTESGVIEFGSDEDWFAFTVPGGANVSISTGLGSLSDTVLRLIGTNGSSQLAFDDDGGPGLASLINWTAPSSGTYYAAVGSYSIGTGSYTMTLTSNLTFDPGDFDLSGDLDLADVDALVGEIVAGNDTPLFDLTQDSFVNNDDLDEWLSLAGNVNLGAGQSYAYGDANLDANVDLDDFAIWNANRFQATAAWSQADFNADGATDVSDFHLWNANKSLIPSRPSNETDRTVRAAVMATPAVEFVAAEAQRQREIGVAEISAVPYRTIEVAADRLANHRTAEAARGDLMDQIFAEQHA